MLSQAAVDADPYIVTSLIFWSVAAYWMWKGALKGMTKHLVPRVTLACAVTLLPITYVLSLFHADEVAVNMRRPAGWAICVGLIWTSYTGIQAGKEWNEQREMVTREVLGIIQEGRMLAEEDNGEA